MGYKTYSHNQKVATESAVSAAVKSISNSVTSSSSFRFFLSDDYAPAIGSSLLDAKNIIRTSEETEYFEGIGSFLRLYIYVGDIAMPNKTDVIRGYISFSGTTTGGGRILSTDELLSRRMDESASHTKLYNDTLEEIAMLTRKNLLETYGSKSRTIESNGR